MGLFDFLSAPQQGGLLDQFGSTVADNRAGLLGFGMNLMAGGPDAMQRAASGFTEGNKQDSYNRQLRQKQAEAQAQRQALQALGQKMGAPAGVADDDRALSLWIAQKNHQDAMGRASSSEAESRRRYDEGQKFEREKFEWQKSKPQSEGYGSDVQGYLFEQRQNEAMGRPVVPMKEWREGKRPTTVKELSPKVIEDFGEKGEALTNQDRLGGTFDDKYAGKWFGDTQNFVARHSGLGDQQSAEWWQDYQR